MRIFLTLFALSAACIARPPRQTLPQDLVAVKNITALALSPDGQRIAFVIREASLAEDKYKSGLWVMPAHGASSPRKVLDDGDSPQWAPGGKKLACLAPRGHDA